MIVFLRIFKLIESITFKIYNSSLFIADDKKIYAVKIELLKKILTFDNEIKTVIAKCKLQF